MTEPEWQVCGSPVDLLAHVYRRNTERQLRLLAVACCRQAPTVVADEVCLRAVAAAEHLADRRDEPAALRAVIAGAGNDAVRRLDMSPARYSPGFTLRTLLNARELSPLLVCDLIRDIVGNPFRTVAVDPAWQTRTVEQLARAAYAERDLPSGHLDPARLAVLADALEEAGCTAADLLGHLRSPGPHVRGCWAVDLLLGEG